MLNQKVAALVLDQRLLKAKLSGLDVLENLLQLRDGRITWIASFLEPSVLARLGVPATA